MTEAEEALLQQALSLNMDSDLGATEILEPYIHAVREERCPADLLDQVVAAELAWSKAIKLYRDIINDLKLNYPPELVEAAMSRAKKEIADGRR